MFSLRLVIFVYGMCFAIIGSMIQSITPIDNQGHLMTMIFIGVIMVTFAYTSAEFKKEDNKIRADKIDK